MKLLTRAYLKKLDKKYISAAVDSDGNANAFEVILSREHYRGEDLWGEHLGSKCTLIGYGFYAGDWKNSNINRNGIK